MESSLPGSLAEFAAVVAAMAISSVGCGRSTRDSGASSAEVATASPRAACAHAACGDDYVVDAAPVGKCAAGDACAVALTLVAVGDYHINDEYPYQFKAEDEPGVDFLGEGGEGKNVFSKAAKNWEKSGEKTGTMTVRFRPQEAGDKSIRGRFKFSVCSAKNCELEHQSLKATVKVL